MLKPVILANRFSGVENWFKTGFLFLLTFIKIYYYIRQIILCIPHCNVRTRKAVSKPICSFSRFSLNEAMNIVYTSGAQRPARGPHPARDESSSGPRCPTRKVTILNPYSWFLVVQFDFHENSTCMKLTDYLLRPDISKLIGATITLACLLC